MLAYCNLARRLDALGNAMATQSAEEATIRLQADIAYLERIGLKLTMLLHGKTPKVEWEDFR